MPEYTLPPGVLRASYLLQFLAWGWTTFLFKTLEAGKETKQTVPGHASRTQPISTTPSKRLFELKNVCEPFYFLSIFVEFWIGNSSLCLHTRKIRVKNIGRSSKQNLSSSAAFLFLWQAGRALSSIRDSLIYKSMKPPTDRPFHIIVLKMVKTLRVTERASKTLECPGLNFLHFAREEWFIIARSINWETTFSSAGTETASTSTTKNSNKRWDAHSCFSCFK